MKEIESVLTYQDNKVGAILLVNVENINTIKAIITSTNGVNNNIKFYGKTVYEPIDINIKLDQSPSNATLIGQYDCTTEKTINVSGYKYLILCPSQVYSMMSVKLYT